jgi:hypothetical protein
MAHRYCPSSFKIGRKLISPPLSTRLIPSQAGNFVREEILSSFIRLVAHTPELQAYTASKLFTSLKSDISQESLTLAATWVIGEYSEILLQSGLVDEENPKPVWSTFFFHYTAKRILLCRSMTQKLST